MSFARPTVLVLMMFALFAGPLAADVIQTRAAEKDRAGDAAAVAKQLQSLGLSGQQTAARIAGMTRHTLSYYASSPEALQVVGQVGPEAGQDIFICESYNFWYETAIGAVVLGGTFVAIFMMVTNGDK